MSKNKHLNISIKTSLFKKMKPTTLSSQPIPSQPFRPASTPTSRVEKEMHELATSFINQRTPDVPASKQIKASIKFLSSSLKRICALWKRLFPKTPASPTAQQQPSSLETPSEPPTAQQQTIEDAQKYSETDENLRSHKQISAQVLLMRNFLNLSQQRTSLFAIFSLAATYNIPTRVLDKNSHSRCY